MNTTPIRTLYQRNIEFSIDGSWGPQFTAILYIHHQLDDMSPEIISTQLTIEKIDNCSSNAIAIQSKSNRTNLKFSQTIADPGEKVKLIILPEGISSLDEKLDDSHQLNNPIQLNDNKGQLLNELCFVRISDVSLDNFQDSNNLVNMKYFVDKLINFAAKSGYRPLTATSTQEAFLAAGFQFGSTYPEPMFIQRAYPCHI
uniref:SJCHGC03234 protein n=1 Tax=Schistosoma japonicum TaxID=6182 RepID=Q5DF24_SCHJA|nr:SJCHGC03234 protein [Schistosoma japonicum]